MRYKKLKVQDAMLIHRNVNLDQRGSFEELFRSKLVCYNNMDVKQINLSTSRRYTVRGIHCANYAKIGTCLNGRMWDVIVDLRPQSPTYLQWDAVWLHGGDGIQVYVPAGCGHGFYADSDNTVFLYFQEDYWKGNENEVSWHWKSLGIQWPSVPYFFYLISDKDKEAPIYKVSKGTENA